MAVTKKEVKEKGVLLVEDRVKRAVMVVQMDRQVIGLLLRVEASKEVIPIRM
jgi:hypothetical protein